MMIIAILFLTVKSIPSFDLCNQSIPCANTISLSYTIFININQLINTECDLKSISISYCSFSQIGYIINNSNESLLLDNFTFDHNCCHNNETVSNQSYISLLAGSCKFQWNTFSAFNYENFIHFDSPKVQISNLNFTNCIDFQTAISIQHQSLELRFNDISFEGVKSKKHICINGSSKNYSIDRINDNGNKGEIFMHIEGSQFIITRVFMLNEMNVEVFNGFIWFIDSYIPNPSYQSINITIPLSGVVVDSMNTLTSSYYINQLSLLECQTNVFTTSYPKHTVASNMKVKIAAGFIGGALFGVVIFLIVYFTVKYSIKCYQKKKDKEHPIFDL